MMRARGRFSKKVTKQGENKVNRKRETWNPISDPDTIELPFLWTEPREITVEDDIFDYVPDETDLEPEIAAYTVLGIMRYIFMEGGQGHSFILLTSHMDRVDDFFKRFNAEVEEGSPGLFDVWPLHFPHVEIKEKGETHEQAAG
jgi:hypothetical protein